MEESSKRCGPYELLERLSTGRVANTFLARRVSGGDVEASGLVSLKVLCPFADVAEQRVALGREAELQTLCAHEGVVPIVLTARGTGASAGEERYIVRRYVSGFSLAELLSRGADVPLDVVGALGDSLLETLAAVHEARASDGRVLGVFHRDVTPSNLLVSLDGDAYLTDFGLAHAPGAFGVLSDEELVQGTPRYVTPEVLRGEQPDGRSDLFQLALVLLEALGCKVRPKVPRVEAMGTGVPSAAACSFADSRASALGPVLTRALEPDPARRFVSAGEMRTAWRDLLGASPSRGERRLVVRAWLDTCRRDQVREEKARVQRALRVGQASIG